MNKTALYCDEKTFWHHCGQHVLFLPVGGWVQPSAGTGNADSPDSKRRILSLVHFSGLAEKLLIKQAPAATKEDLLRVHSPHYLDEFKRQSDAQGGDLGGLAPFSQGGYEIAAISAGLAKAAIDDVLSGEVSNSFSLSRPAGHHCLPDQSMGFCLLANISIAIEAAKKKHGVRRIAVVDWDVHHGNGTQTIFYNRPDVLTISLHQDKCFPPGYSGAEDRGSEAGLGYNLNIPLLPGGGHDAYMYAMERIVAPAINAFKPELIIVASGLDANALDPLARMLLHSESYRSMTRLMMQLAAQHCEGRLAVIHEGGYSEAYVPFCALAILEELSGQRTKVQDPLLELVLKQQPNPRFTEFQRSLIDELASSFGL